MKTKKYIFGATVLAAVIAVASVSPAFAETNKSNNNGNDNNNGRGPGMMWGRGTASMGMMRPVVAGTVSSVSGNTITINGRQGLASTSATTVFTIDATNAKVLKNRATSTVSSIVVGDTLIVQGTLSGTNVVATIIHDGLLPNVGMGMFGKGDDKNGKEGNGHNGSTTPAAILGNGQPVVAGTVSSISGSTLSITNKSNVTYTVDATNAKILKGQNTVVAISNISVGDMIIVQGTVNGSSIVATTVIDQTGKVGLGQQNNPSSSDQNPQHMGFFGGIGQFFSHLFGF